MLKIGDKFPIFQGKAVVGIDIQNAFFEINSATYANKWQIFFFWPMDFTFICPTEIAEFGRLYLEFSERGAEIIGVSTDSEFVHLAWKQQTEELRDLPFPMFSDITRELSDALGIFNQEKGVAERATFIVDPQGIIRFIMVSDLNVGRNPKEVLRVLDALQTDKLCPCNWQKGEPTLAIG